MKEKSPQGTTTTTPPPPNHGKPESDRDRLQTGLKRGEELVTDIEQAEEDLKNARSKQSTD